MLGGSDSALNIVVKLVDKASGELKGLSDNIDKFGQGIKDQTETARGFTKVMAVTGGIVGGYALNEFRKFEETMSGVKAVLSPTADEFKRLSAEAQQLGKDSKFSQEEAAAGIEMLAKNGLSTQQILDGAAKSTLDLAAATGSDLTIAADISTDAMAIFNIQAAEMAKAVNGISGVTVASKFTIEDYSLALAQGGGVASAVGVEFDDFNTSIAAISPLFKSGSDAGTSFKVFLQRLVPQGKAATEAMMELGLITEDGKNQFYDAAGSLKSMSEISGILQKATGNLTEEQKNSYLSLIFGTDAMRAAAGMAKVGADGFNDLAEKIGKVDAAEQAATRLDNFSGSMEKLMGNISFYATMAGAAIADKLRPAIDAVVVALDDMGAFWASLSPQMQTAITIVGGITAALAGLVFVVGAIGIALPLITTGLSAVAGAFAFLLSPIGLVIAAIAAFTIAYQTNFGGFADFIDGIVARVAPLFEFIWGKVQEMATQVIEWVLRMQEPFMQFVEFVEPFVSLFLDNLFTFFSNTFDNLLLLLEGAFQIISGVFQTSFAIISGFIEVFINLFTGNWRGAWEALKIMTSGAFAGIQQIFSGGFKIIQAILGEAWDIIKAVFSTSWDFIVQLGKSGLDLMVSAWTNSMTAIGNVVGSVWENIKQTIAAGINWVIDKINWLIDKANSVAGAVPGVPTIPRLPALRLQNGGLAKLQSGGLAGTIIPGGKNPSDHDKIPAMLDPGELVLNRAQQANLAGQLMGGGTQNTILNINIGGNNFYGDDETFADKIGEKIINVISQNLALQSF